MDRVLLDATTMISATRLLNGEDKPSALNVYSLSLLVESLILHSELIVLNTSSTEDFGVSERARVFGDAVRVDSRSTDDVVDRYIELNTLRADGPTPPREVIKDLTFFMAGGAGGYDPNREINGYLDALNAAHQKQFQNGRERWHHETAPELPGPWEDVLEDDNNLHQASNVQPPAADHPIPRVNVSQHIRIADRTELREFGAPGATASVLPDMLKRYDMPRDTLWSIAKAEERTYLTEFAPAMVLRTGFYLIASEVFAIPYRPDILRAPVCWKFFDHGSFAELAIDERIVDLAEDVARARVASANQLIGRHAFVALPLFLGRVLSESATPTDIIANTMRIRQSPEAHRFRKVMAGLAQAQEAGDISVLIQDAGRYSDLLRRAYGSTSGGGGSTDVLWSLAGDGTKAVLDPTGASLVTLGGSVAKTAIRGPEAMRRWSYGRKMALIGRTIRAANKAMAMNSELKRLFGAGLSAGDVAFLEQVGRLGFDLRR